MASVTEATFNWGGFLAAMGSNITFQSRNVLSKKFMGKDTKVNHAVTLPLDCHTLLKALQCCCDFILHHECRAFPYFATASCIGSQVPRPWMRCMM